MPRKKKAALVKAATRAALGGKPGKPRKAAKAVRVGGKKEERRLAKLEQRRRDKAKITPGQWAEPAPAHLVGTLNVPRAKSKYQSYFEFAENTEKKKKLEFQNTNDPNPPPGFAFIPVGDPDLTNMCKDLSRNRDAMIFIVSASRDGVSRVSEQMYRTGYHFREAIVDDARALVGETFVASFAPGQIEPIPEAQEEITKQADAAIRDLFPRIPHTDRTTILEHAFKKGALFHGEPTVGLQPTIPLSRRVQLAVLAHIRHTHTRYDKLLRETTWMNARKVVEPVCLDILVKWRGDEETGRDQLDEILREVVILTDSEDEDGGEGEVEEGDSNGEEDGSSEDGEVTSESSPDIAIVPNPSNQQKPPRRGEYRPPGMAGQYMNESTSRADNVIASRTRSKTDPKKNDGRHRGTQRYRNAWVEAIERQGSAHHHNRPLEDPANRRQRSIVAPPVHGFSQHPPSGQPSLYRSPNQSQFPERYSDIPTTRPASHHSLHRPTLANMMPRHEVVVSQQAEQHRYHGTTTEHGAQYQSVREQRPPQVVTGSPQRHGLQDMLLPSIETTSSHSLNPSTHAIEQRDMRDRFSPAREAYPRVAVDDRRLSPPQRQVIVIDDDSPHVKRRRMVRADDTGRFRPIPSLDYTVHASSPAADSQFIRPSSVQLRESSFRRPAIQSEYSQGLLGGVRSSYHSTGQIPIYDAPDPDSLARPSEHFRREHVDTGHREDPRHARQMGSPIPPVDYVGESVYRRPILESEVGREVHDMRMYEPARGPRPVERDYRVTDVPRGQSSNVPFSNAAAPSYDMGPRPVLSEQALSHEFSQSRLDSQAPRRDGFSVSDRPHMLPQNSSRDNFTRTEGYSDRSIPAIPPARARSPARYAERPMYHAESHRPLVYDQNLPIYDERYAASDRPPVHMEQQSSSYGRNSAPRGPIILLD